jgi:hypothetical protein
MRQGQLAPGIKSPFGRGKPSLPEGDNLQFEWRGRKAIEALMPAVERGLQRAREDAERYWREVIWTRANHPYMTGTERDAGRFDVVPGATSLKAELRVWVDMDAEYVLWEEFGLPGREGHFPMRRTLDWVAPRIAQYIREEIAAELQQGTGV